MKNEQKIKALFFAQYLGQKVYTDEYHLHEEPLPIIAGVLNIPIYGFLLLRSVNQLTDEELDIVLEKVAGIGQYEYTYEQNREIILRMFTEDFEDEVEVSPAIIVEVNDYFKAIGVIRPFLYIDETGHPQTLSTEDIIARKWAQIVTT
jgi:hypothetical protein